MRVSEAIPLFPEPPLRKVVVRRPQSNRLADPHEKGDRGARTVRGIGGSQSSFLLAERARSECARSMRAVRTARLFPMGNNVVERTSEIDARNRDHLSHPCGHGKMIPESTKRSQAVGC